MFDEFIRSYMNLDDVTNSIWYKILKNDRKLDGFIELGRILMIYVRYRWENSYAFSRKNCSSYKHYDKCYKNWDEVRYSKLHVVTSSYK